MAIDYNALRRFQEMWGPVMDALPSILEITARQADADRALKLTKLDHEKALKEVDAVYIEADKRLIEVNKELDSVKAAEEQLHTDIQRARDAHAEETKKAINAQQEALLAVNNKLIASTAKLNSVEAEYAAKVATAEKAAADRISALEADVKELEKRKAAAEKALATLRDKLG